MKKVLLFLLSVSTIAFAQIPNASFENWSSTPGTGINAPTGWYLGAVAAEGVAKVPGVTNGTYAVKLKNVDLFTVDTMQTALTGVFKVLNVPTKITGYYLCDMKGIDSASISLILGSKEKALSHDDASAFAYLTFGGYHPTFTYFEAPVKFLTNERIDTGGVMLNSDALMGRLELHDIIHPESYIVFDQLALDFTPLSIEHQNLNSLKLYPNPASHFFQLDNVQDLQEYILQDLTGATVSKGALKSGTNTIDLHSFASGTYLLVTRSKTGVFTSKLIVN